MKTKFRNLFVILLLFILALPMQSHARKGEALNEPDSRILFIFDASYSMAGPWEKGSKINIARNILMEMVDSLQQLGNVEMALRVYGHQSPVPPQDCSDTRLEVPFAPENAARIRQTLRFLSPKGTTPIAHSLELAANDFPESEQCRNIIIMITDGVEACDGDPCAVSRELQKKGIALRPFVVGIGNDPNFRETFGCMGHYFDAPSEQQFKIVMKIVISEALNTTSAQVDLRDSGGYPSETNVAILIQDQNSAKVRYNMIHTLNSKGNPDTLSIDHLGTYNIIAQTIPPVSADSVELVTGKHNHIGLDAPQGFLRIRTKGGNVYDDEKILVKRANDPKTINVQFMESSERYLVGKYDLEIPVFPLIFMEDVEIRQSYTTTVEIAEPGMVHIASQKYGYGTMFRVTPGGDQEWVMNLRTDVTQQYYNLQPGRYRIVFREKGQTMTMFTKIRDFVIRPGLTEFVNLE